VQNFSLPIGLEAGFSRARSSSFEIFGFLLRVFASLRENIPRFDCAPAVCELHGKFAISASTTIFVLFAFFAVESSVPWLK
jgi:hypothetical protein